MEHVPFGYKEPLYTTVTKPVYMIYIYDFTRFFSHTLQLTAMESVIKPWTSTDPWFKETYASYALTSHSFFTWA